MTQTIPIPRQDRTGKKLDLIDIKQQAQDKKDAEKDKGRK